MFENKTDKDYLKIAVRQAEKSLKLGGFPAGAIIVKNGKIISKGVSLGFKRNDPTEHAETSSIRKACKKLKTINLSGAILYASLQPCLMCFSTANWAGISKIVFGCKKTEKMIKSGCYEGKNDIYKINNNNKRKIELIYISDYENQSLELIKKWDKK
jgi:tRNA(Arg) A34 adenosine deaminase TadA